MVNGQALYTVNILDEAMVNRERNAMRFDSMAASKPRIFDGIGD
jgi:hypothetical protein